jgi:hypothetical protein
MFRFSAIARFEDGSTWSTANDPESLFAVSAESACRKFWWRLPAERRRLCLAITISAWVQGFKVPWDSYGGPDVEFSVSAGRLVMGRLAEHEGHFEEG